MQSTKGHPSIFAGQFQTESVWIFWENSNLSFASQSPELQHLWFNLLFHMTNLDETRTHVRNSQQWCDVAKHTQGKRKEVGPNWARWEISLKASTHAVPLTSTDVSKG